MGLRCVNQRPMKPGHRQSEGSMLKKIIKQADSTRQHQDTRTSGHQDTRRCRKVEIGWRDGEMEETGMSVEVAVWQVGGHRRRGMTTSATSRVIIPAVTNGTHSHMNLCHVAVNSLKIYKIYKISFKIKCQKNYWCNVADFNVNIVFCVLGSLIYK